MNLFEVKERISEEYSFPGEGIIDFLDRSGFDWAADVRNYLNEWIDKYPENEVQELIARMRSDIESPFFELFLHEFFLQLGFSTFVHPTLNGSKKRPDFLIENSGTEAYIEARLVTEEKDEERKLKKRKQDVLDIINEKVRSKNFFISIVDLELKSNHSASLKRLCKSLKDFLDSQDPDNLEYIYRSRMVHSELGCFIFDNQDIFIKIGLIPRPKEYRNEYGDRIIGISEGSARMMDTANAIRTRIQKKSGRYGDIQKPFIVALNITSPFGLFWDDVTDALYGSEVYNLSTKQNSRRNNGVFGDDLNRRLTRISGVLVSNIHHMTIHKSSIRYFQNPYANIPFSLKPSIDEVRFEAGNVELNEGHPLKKYITALSNWI